MKKSFLNLPEDMTPRARNAFRAVLTFVPATVIVLSFLLYQAFQAPSWQLWSAAGSVGILLVFVLLGLRFTLRNQPERGIWWTFVPWLFILLFNSALVSGLGLLTLVSAITIVISVGGPTLPDRQRSTFIATGVVFGFLSLLVDLFIPTERIIVQGFQTVVYVVLGLCLLILGAVIFRQFHNYSLRTKLISVVALVFALVAMAQFQIFSVNTRQQIESEAKERMIGNYQVYAGRIAAESIAAEALATSIAARADVQELYLKNDRDGLYALLLPMFEDLKERQIVHLYIERPNGTVFLRVHNPEKFGDDVTYRSTAADALALKEATSGIEIGPNRLGIRGVAPMFSGNQFIGMIEVGLDFDQQFVTDLKELTGAEFSMYVSYEAAALPNLKPAEGVPDAPIEELFYYTSSSSQTLPVDPDLFRSTFVTGTPGFQIVTKNTSTPSVVYITPLLGYKNKSLGLLEISAPYVETLSALQTIRIIGLSAVGGLTLIGLLLVLLAISRFVLAPINSLTEFAGNQLSGNTSTRVHVDSGDEFEKLANTFNSLASSVEEERRKLEQRTAEHTQNLETAAEVGRAVSQVRALDVMLEDACELIQKEFDLYYVQVYLTDPGQTTLRLQAGTGEVGAQLRERGHRLPLNASSINGRAAVEKRAVVISDTAESATFRPNELLPDTRGEMAVPLIVAEKVVGVLDMQSSQPGVLNEEVLPAFEALAGQLAVAIQNANLVAEAEAARAEVEAQARRLVRTGWVEHLDAIHKPEHIGFVFDRNEIAPLDEAGELPDESRAVSAPISLTGEELGSLVVELDDGNKNEQTRELVNIVARQVAQQIENLRLLESAERYRFEAEQAARRQTREGWQEYIKTKTDATLSYLYDLNEVRPYRNGHETDASALTLPLKVRDETLGKLSVDGLTPDDKDSLELASAVAERLGAHIESLRLSEQIEKRAHREQTLREITSALRGSTNPETIMRTAVRELGSILGRKIIVQVLPSEQGDQVESAEDNGNDSDPIADLPESA